jgi:O-antigen biosynthesis protein
LKENEFPYVSIVTVNYNGKAFLKDLFGSLLNLEYPEEKIEVLMVDNASSDGSVSYVRENFPNVKVIVSDKNRGYAGGNNLGIKNASHPFVALINNDMTVDRKWLSALAQSLDTPKKVCAAGSKVLFFFAYIRFDLCGAGTFRLSGLRLQKKNEDPSQAAFAQESIKVRGARGGKDASGNLFYDFDSKGSVDVPFRKDGTAQSFSFRAKADAPIRISSAGKDILFQKNGDRILVEMDGDLPLKTFRIINSAGIEINKALYSRDRGYEEVDAGQFEKQEELFGLSGSSLLVDRRLFAEAGYFDETFFTYYEDIDFFYRARLQGFKMVYSPGSIAYHYHCGTGKEWSYSFTYYVLRNRLLMIFKNSPFPFFLKQYMVFCASAARHLLGYAKARARGVALVRPDIPIRMRLLFSFPFFFLGKAAERFRIRRAKKDEDILISKWFREF